MEGRISEAAVKALILSYGRNIGSWAPGELDNILKEGKIVRIPVDTYKKWFDCNRHEGYMTKLLQPAVLVESGKKDIRYEVLRKGEVATS